MTRGRALETAWSLGVVLSAFSTAAVTLADLWPAGRPYVVGWFMLFGPGWPIVAWLRIESFGAAWTLALALSIGLSAVTAMILVYTAWRVPWGIGVLVTVCLATECARWVHRRRPTKRPV